MIWEFFIPIVCFLGLVAGIILAKVSPEEMKPGKKFFIVFRLAVLVLLIVFLLYYARSEIIFILLGFIIGYFLRWTYLYFGIALTASFLATKEHVLIIASLIFLYGLPYGTLLESHKKLKLKKFLLLILMFLAPFTLLLLKSYLNPAWLFSFSAGLLIGSLRKEF